MNNPDGDAMDPAIARILVFYHEAVAQAAGTAYLDLYALGFNKREVDAIILRGWRPRTRPQPTP